MSTKDLFGEWAGTPGGGGSEKGLTQWGAEALGALHEYAAAHPLFMSENVRAYAHGVRRIAMPRDSRSWGPVFNAAAKEGWITSLGTDKTRDRISHNRPANVWRSNLHNAASLVNARR